MIYGMVPLSMTLNMVTVNPDFKDTPLLDVGISATIQDRHMVTTDH